MKKHLSLLAAAAVSAGVLAGVSGAGAAGASYPAIPAGPIVIGATTPLSGATAAYGQSTEESFDNVTIKAFNAEFPDGIDGHPIKLVFLDDQGTVTGGVQSAEQLVSEHVAAVVTLSYNPEATLQQAVVLNHAHIPVISVLSYSQFVNTKAYPYDFATGASIPQEAVATAKWLKAEGLTRLAVVDDGETATSEVLASLKAELPKYSPKTKIVTVQQVSPAAVEVSPQIAAVKAANPDAVYVDTGEAYGPIWQAMQTDGLTNVKILASAGAWYDSFSAMGPLAANAYAPYDDCAPSASTAYPAQLTDLMGQYSAATYGYSTNYRTYVATDTVPLLLLKYAIEKEHSDTPDAIKAGIESIHNQDFDTFEYNFSPTNHFGIEGSDSAAVCQMAAPYAGGVGKIPVISKG